MALYAFVRGFRIRKDKIPYYDIKRLIRSNKWVIRGVCKERKAVRISKRKHEKDKKIKYVK